MKGLKKRLKLPKEWPEWLESLRNYAASINEQLGAWPVRLVLTNGKWFIVFKDPESTFSTRDTARVEDIVVFTSAEDVLQRSGEMFSLLEHHSVLEQQPELLPGELRSVLDVKGIERYAFALKLMYSVSPTEGTSKLPVITVLPMLLLKSSKSAWVRVTSGSDARQLPTEYTREHLEYHLLRLA